MKLYYAMKPLIPRRLQVGVRRCVTRLQYRKKTGVWPIDPSASKPPDAWPGWPEGKQFALVLTHDVDTASGQDKCLQLLGMEKRLGFRSSFNFVPERYEVDPRIRRHMTEAGFEIGVHGLNHDGKLFQSKKIFQERCQRINHYVRSWNAVGFRSPAMHHNLLWIHDLDVEYDASTFDTDPFEPQSDGAGTIFPFHVVHPETRRSYVELPYTLPQDFTVFILLQEKGTALWRKKLHWIVENGGMVLVNTHPDYMAFNGGKHGFEEYPAAYYREFLEYIADAFAGKFWHALPCEMACYWKALRARTRNGCTIERCRPNQRLCVPSCHLK